MKILDLSCDIAGRFGSRLFAMAGEEVFRCPPAPGKDDSLTLYLDSRKTIVKPGQLADLVPQCDLVWTSFDRGVLQGYGADIDIPETSVQVTTSSYGMTGPYAGWRGGPMADWAAGGYLYITGEPDREPLSGPEYLCGYAAGYTAAIGAEAALIDRSRSGRGRRLDISTMESMLLLHQSTFSRAGAGVLRQRTGRYTEVYPLTVLPCRDGYVSVGVVTDAEFDKLAIAVGIPELAVDPRFSDRQRREDNRDDLDKALAGYLDNHDTEEIVMTLQKGGVACASVAGPLEVTRNPQLESREFWETTPGGGLMPGDPLKHFIPHSDVPEAPSSPGADSDLPLAGVRVLDFTIFWAGPSATRTLADLGAEVIWVEQPGARFDTFIEEGSPASPDHLQLNLYDTFMFRGKNSIELDLGNPEDRATVYELAREAHIVVENFRPGVAKKLGIDAATLSRLNVSLTFVSLSGWGSNGPWADWRSYGPSIEAASSIEGRTGYIDGEPLRLGHTLPDGIGGLIGTLAALRGLRRQLLTGKAGWFDISQLEAYVSISGEEIIEATEHGRGMERIGNRSQFGAFQGVFPCKGVDQWIGIRLENAEDCRRFNQISGIPVLLDCDPKPTEQAVANFTERYQKSELAIRLQESGLEAFPVLDAFELINDPHLAERDYFLHVPVNGQTYALPGNPFAATPPMTSPKTRAPRPGEHSDEIRRGL